MRVLCSCPVNVWYFPDSEDLAVLLKDSLLEWSSTTPMLGNVVLEPRLRKINEFSMHANNGGEADIVLWRYTAPGIAGEMWKELSWQIDIGRLVRATSYVSSEDIPRNFLDDPACVNVEKSVDFLISKGAQITYFKNPDELKGLVVKQAADGIAAAFGRPAKSWDTDIWVGFAARKLLMSAWGAEKLEYGVVGDDFVVEIFSSYTELGDRVAVGQTCVDKGQQKDGPFYKAIAALYDKKILVNADGSFEMGQERTKCFINYPKRQLALALICDGIGIGEGRC